MACTVFLDVQRLLMKKFTGDSLLDCTGVQLGLLFLDSLASKCVGTVDAGSRDWDSNTRRLSSSFS